MSLICGTWSILWLFALFLTVLALEVTATSSQMRKRSNQWLLHLQRVCEAAHGLAWAYQ